MPTPRWSPTESHAEQQRPHRGAALVVLPPPEREPEHEHLGQAHLRVDLGAGGVVPEVAREGEHERRGHRAEVSEPLLAQRGEDPRRGRRGQHRLGAGLRGRAAVDHRAAPGDADQAQRGQVREHHGEAARQRRQAVHALGDAADRDQRGDAAEQHVERRAGRMRDAEDLRDRDELARVPEGHAGEERAQVDAERDGEDRQREDDGGQRARRGDGRRLGGDRARLAPAVHGITRGGFAPRSRAHTARAARSVPRAPRFTLRPSPPRRARGSR